MLSIVDIKRELGKNIYIFPLDISSIKANSIDLHASQYAWSIQTKKSLYNGIDRIIIPAHDTALIYSKEAIYVSNKIGGTYHSKVRLVSQGLGHIGTTLDAQYIGLSIIAIHNISDCSKDILVGSEFVTIIFNYLHSEDYKDTVSHDNPPGHPSLIASFEGISDFLQWEEKNRWCRSKTELYLRMTESEEYKMCKAQFKKEQITFNRKFWKNKVFKYLFIILVWVVLNCVLSIPAYFIDLGNISTFSVFVIEKFSIPLILSIIIPNLLTDIKMKNNLK